MAGCIPATPEKDLRWRKLMEFLQDKPYGFKATYLAIQEILGVDREHGRSDIYRARKELERHYLRTLKCVHGEGYRIVEPKEHASLMQDRNKRARRQIVHGLQIGISTNRSLLTPDEARILADTQARMGRSEQMLRAHGKRLDEVEQRVEVVEQAMLSAQLADMQARLSRIEQAKTH